MQISQQRIPSQILLIGTKRLKFAMPKVACNSYLHVNINFTEKIMQFNTPSRIDQVSCVFSYRRIISILPLLKGDPRHLECRQFPKGALVFSLEFN